MGNFPLSLQTNQMAAITKAIPMGVLTWRFKMFRQVQAAHTFRGGSAAWTTTVDETVPRSPKKWDMTSSCQWLGKIMEHIEARNSGFPQMELFFKPIVTNNWSIEWLVPIILLSLSWFSFKANPMKVDFMVCWLISTRFICYCHSPTRCVNDGSECCLDGQKTTGKPYMEIS